MVALGIFGYIMRKLDFELGPFLLAFVLEELFENSFRQSLMLSDGSPAIFFSRPISAALLGVALVFVITTAVSVIRRSKAKKRGAAIG